MGQLTRLGRNCVLNDGLEARLIQTLMCPILKYGAESWTLKKQQAESIGAFLKCAVAIGQCESR